MAVWVELPGGRLKRFRNRPTRCPCAKRRKGRPRVGYGLCTGDCEARPRVWRRCFRAELRGAERDERRWEGVGRFAPYVRS